jgi:tetratricopeptide (TPR) repeat protein
MTQEAADLSFDWDAEPAIDAEEEYSALLRSLRRKAGFGLLFVRCSPVAGTRLIERVKTDLPDKSIGVLSFEAAIPGGDFYQQVENYVAEQGQKKILFVQGLEYSLTSYEKAQRTEAGWSSEEIYNYSWKAVPRLLGNLNLRREKFRDNFATCFVFLLPLFALKYITRRAPDFFDWRSGVFELPSDQETVERESIQIWLEADYEEYGNWSQAERDRQIVNIQAWLDEPNQTSDLKVNLLIQLGVLFDASERYVSAIISFDQALKIRPDDQSVWYDRGIMLSKLGRYEEAITSYDQALKFKSDNYLAWNNRGSMLDKLGRHEEALSSYNQALKFKPEVYQIWYNRGIVLDELGRYEEALSSYNQALKLKPDDRSVIHNRNIVLRILEHQALIANPQN